MKDSQYIQDISTNLYTLIDTIKTLGKFNLHDMNIHAEYFFRDFYNELRGLNLVNANDEQQNEAGIDLVDNHSRVVIQVTSTATRGKIKNSFAKVDKVKYNGFRFEFLFLERDVADLRKGTYDVPDGLVFDPANDIWDISKVIAKVQSADIAKKEVLYKLIEKHLQSNRKPVENPTALAKVVEVLSKEIDSFEVTVNNTQSFIIEEKIKHNHLETVSGTITDHALYTIKLNSIYESSEEFGRNPRRSIHSKLRKIYEVGRASYSAAELYWYITESVTKYVQESSNCPKDLYKEDIEWAASVIVADAFEACKIFEHPKKQD